MRLAAGTRLGTYEIAAPLGKGGMGEVYRALDGNLGREVALKVLPKAFTNDPVWLSRFRREARILAALNHPNIATIHDLKECDGLHFLVMELVPGETLAERVESGPLELSQALRLAGLIAEALEAAHARGIIHRDLKPANVKVTPEGRLKLLDFGLAKNFGVGSEQADGDPATLTASGSEPGLILGTPGYMSPEQARAQPVDKRADIWAFGCVLYELLTGRRAFPGETFADAIAAVVGREPDLQALPPSIPANIRGLLRRCLQKDPDNRLRDIVEARIEIEQALRAPAPVEQPKPQSSAHSLAVLPFANAGGDPQMEYLSDGLTESIILSLSQLSELRVMSRSAVFRFKGPDEDAREFGRKLGVDTVLSGRVLQRGESMVVSAELVDVEKGWQLWGAQYRRGIADIFATEEDIAKEISKSLLLKLTPEKQNLLSRRYTDDVEAYQLFLKGRYYWGKRTEDALKKGMSFFRQAIEKDPTYALAYAGLAEGYVPLAFYCHLHPSDAYPKAKAAAQRALEIDPNLSEARTVLGSVRAFYDLDLQGAENECRAAIELNPAYPRVRQALAELLTVKKRFAEAIAESRRALELDPLSLHTNASVAMTLYFSRQYVEAVEQGRANVEMDPNFFPARFFLALAYQQLGRFSEAAAELEQARTLSSNSTLMLASLGSVFADEGREHDARGVLRELEDLARQRKYVSQVIVAAIQAALGDRDRALSSVEKAREERCPWLLLGLTVDPRLDSLRGEPRFKSLVNQIGLAE
jgi:serine/threonine protein kinase/tetratricopeptide (TPR) repeat protein